LHLKHGLEFWNTELSKCNITNGDHINFLLNPIKKGLLLRSLNVNTGFTNISKINVKEFKSPLSFSIGNTEDGSECIIKSMI
jgi:DNA sulfur modification protein DndE